MPKHLAAVYALAQCYMEQRFYSGTIKLLEKTPKEVGQTIRFGNTNRCLRSRVC